MAKKKEGDSKQGLIIALVCFVVLSLGLGVAAYYGYADNATDKGKAKEAEAKASSMEKNRNWYKYLYLQIAQYAGHLDPKQASDLTSLAGSNLTGDEKAAVDQLFAALKAKLVKDNNAAEYYSEKVARLTKELGDTKTLLANTQKQLATANGTIKQNEDDLAKERADWKKKLDDANAQNLKDRQDQEAKFAKMLEEFGDLNKQIAELRKKAENDNDASQKRIKVLTGTVKQTELELTKARDALKPPDLLKFDTPKGSIIRLDPRADVAWINIGSADNLRASEGVTFSIFSSSTGGKVGGERKGALEVVDVTGAHLAKAKITEITDPNRDPIVTGDLLINPAWNSTNRTHVAVTGLIDMTGEGRDQIDEFLRVLKREGIVVDAYLDLRDLNIKGDGMTLKTDYLIVGEAPNLTTNFSYKADDPRVTRKTGIGEKMAEMRKQATELGVTVVPMRRFAMLTGYRLPKGVGVQTGAGYDFIRQSETLSAPEKQPDKKNGKTEAKPEKKDDNDK